MSIHEYKGDSDVSPHESVRHHTNLIILKSSKGCVIGTVQGCRRSHDTLNRVCRRSITHTETSVHQEPGV